MPFRSFSNFRALRRALRYLSAGTSEVPRIFAVFIDTTSRITNFQPTSWNDSSLRVQSFPAPGRHQFPPIFAFSSVDVYSRILNYPMCISSPEYVAEPERLLKFGRAGWYSMYFHGNVFRKANLPQSDPILSTATSKLLCTSDLHRSQEFFNARVSLTPANLIKLIAVLAPRLALTIGPYALEASELIASHLAVLTRTDDERRFLRTVYPSEPILAEVSARLTHNYGWANPLYALVHYVQGGIVEAGFRGELITKIVCLMPMDKALSQIPVPENRWQYSQPIPVSNFLNHLIVPLRGYSTFSEGLKGVQDRDSILYSTLNIDNEKLQRFLHGYVFFNHFVRVDVKLSYSMLVHAWNRGAAIMCMTNTKGIDHVIPFKLETKVTSYSARSMVLRKRNIINKHVSTSLTSSSTQRVMHRAKIKSEQPGRQGFRREISENTGTVSKTTKRRRQIHLMSRKTEMTKHSRKTSMRILSMYGKMITSRMSPSEPMKE